MDDIDYRKLTTIQLKYELKQLERRILEITGDPLETGFRRFLAWANDKSAVEQVDEMMSTRSYLLNLLFEKHCTPEEVFRLEKVNSLLKELSDRTHKRTGNLARKVLSTPHEELDDDFTIESKLVPEFDIPYSVLRLSDDAFYHYDTPLLVDHEMDILRRAGFSDVRIMKKWGESTCTVLSAKQH